MKILVFDIGGTAIKYGSCVDGCLMDVKEVPTEAHKGGRHIMDTLISLVGKENGYDAIGVSSSGQVHAEKGHIIYANSNIPGDTGTEIKKELETLFGVPVAVENDVNAAALGEAVYGAAREMDSFLCLTYGTGIGGAIVEHKTVYHGSGYSAAEFGAIVTHGEAKRAGTDYFDGCYERYASTTALVQKAMAYDSTLTNGRKLFERLEETKDPRLQEILDDWIHEIMLGLATLTHIFNPSCILLGGGVMVQPKVIHQVQALVDRYVMPSFANVRILPAALGNQAGLLGANYLAEQLCYWNSNK